MLSKSLRKRRPALDILFDGSQRLPEQLVFGLFSQNIQALDYGKACVDHHSELARKNRQVTGFELVAKTGNRDLLLKTCAFLPNPVGYRPNSPIAEYRENGF